MNGQCLYLGCFLRLCSFGNLCHLLGLKKIDEEAERKIKGMFKEMFNDLSAMSESDEDMLAAQQRRRMAKRAA